MSVKFSKIKRTQLLRAVVTAVSAGLSAGFLAVGAVLLAWKLGAFSLSAGAAAGICAGICVGVAALIGLPLFFALRPSDEKIARRLDAEHGLNEKIQTMVEYGNREGEMVALQRADAAERLERLPAKKNHLQTHLALYRISRARMRVIHIGARRAGRVGSRRSNDRIRVHRKTAPRDERVDCGCGKV